MILDQYGKPLTHSDVQDTVQGGWQLTGGLSGPVSLPQQAGMLGALSRTNTQKAAVVAWYLNPLLYGAIEVIKSFVVGARLSYGQHPDKAVQAVMEDFWALNKLDLLIERWFTEYLLLGECLTIWPNPKKFKRTDQAARIGLYTIIDQALDITSAPGLPDQVESIGIGGGRTLRDGEFVWSTNDAIMNEVRGWPPIARALGPALAYVNFANARLKVHELAARINAVYYAFAKDDKELAAKSARFANVPRNGAVLTLAQNADGKSERFEITTPDTKAADSASDGKVIKQLLAVALGLPEHYLAEGGGVTRTTADSMGEPARRGFERRQTRVWYWLQDMLRTELRRRHPGKTFKTKAGRGGRTVSADLVEFPINFPSLRNEDLLTLVEKVKVAAEQRLASQETLSAELGYDWAAEQEKIASAEAEGQDPAPKDTPER